jgi:hypothetical protein
MAQITAGHVTDRRCKMMNKEILVRKKIKRRKFFTNTGKGIFALFILKIFPFSLFGKKKKFEETIKIQIHPAAIRRRSRGLKDERF